MDCEPESLKETLDDLYAKGYCGAMVTGRLRVDAGRMANRYFTATDSLGVANVIKVGPELFASNTEGSGFMAPLEGVTPSTALVLGAGTGARMACLALLKHGWKVRVWNRTIARSRALVIASRTAGELKLMVEADPNRCGLVVNATSLGAKAGEFPPVLWENSSPNTIAYDLVHREHVHTEFLRSAASRGFRTLDAIDYASNSVAQAFQWLLGTGPSTDKIASLLRSL